MFSVDSYAKIWKVKEVKDNYTVCEISTSRKNKDGKYETDFSDGRVRFVGKAHRQRPLEGQKIKILACGVSSFYDKEKKKSFNTFVVFDYVLDTPVEELKPIDEDLPFDIY